MALAGNGVPPGATNLIPLNEIVVDINGTFVPSLSAPAPTNTGFSLTIDEVDNTWLEASPAAEAPPSLVTPQEHGHLVTKRSLDCLSHLTKNDFEGISPDLRWEEEGPQHVPSEKVMYLKLGLAAKDERENKVERMLAIIQVMQIFEMSWKMMVQPP